MRIHWGAKWMIIPYDGRQVMIQGMLSQLQDEVVVQL
jgi:hypothetical protein